MTNYVFKIKAYTKDDEFFSPVLIAICCPLEALYDSVKATEQLKGIDAFITKTDYLEYYTDEDGKVVSNYIKNDVFVGDLKALYKSKDLKDWLLNCEFVEDVSNACE